MGTLYYGHLEMNMTNAALQTVMSKAEELCESGRTEVVEIAAPAGHNADRVQFTLGPGIAVFAEFTATDAEPNETIVDG